MTRTRIALLCVFSLLLLSTSAWAQTGAGQISGTVLDSTGAVIVGANVKITQDRTGASRTTTTTHNGTFVVANLPAGPYTIEISYTGFRTHVVKEIEVSVGTDRTIRVTLEPGAVETTVMVAEAAVLVQTTEATISNLIDATTLVQLPLNRRNPLHLLSLIPGVVGNSAQATSSTGTVTHFVQGDRGRGILTTLDGIDISDPIIPRGELTNAPVNPDMVQEFRVTTALPRAEYGRNSGAQIEMVTRSGGNEFHGGLYHFFRNTALDANNFFNNVSGVPRELLQQNQFGASFSGPILHDKLFFFFNYEGTRRNQSFTQANTTFTQAARQGLFRFVRGTVNGRAGTATLSASTLVNPDGSLRSGAVECSATVTNNCIASYNIFANDPRGIGPDPTMMALINLYPLPNDFSAGDGLNTALFRWNAPAKAPVDTYTGKVDWIISPKYEFSTRYNIAARNHLIGDFINGGLPRTPNSGVGRSRLARNQSASTGVKMLWRSNLVNDARLGFTRTSLSFADTSHPHRSGQAPFNTVPELRTTVLTSPFILWGGTFRFPEHFQLKDNLSWQKGTHSLRFGADLRYYRFNNRRNVGSNPQGSGISIFPSVFFTQGVVPFTGTTAVPTMNATDANRLRGMFNELLGIVAQMDQSMYSNGREYLPGNALIMYQRQREYSFYAQDDWRITNRLTLNFGLRYELFGVPYDTGGLQVVPDRPLNQGPVTFIPAGPGTGRDWYRTDYNDLAPAVGFAWDPFGNGRTAVRGGYRISYNRLVGWALNVLEQRQPAIQLDPQWRGECLNPVTRTVGSCGTTFTQPLRLFELNLHPRVQVVNGVPSLTAPSPNTVISTPANNRNESPFFFDDNFRTAYVHQFSLNVQREIRHGLVAEVGYVGTLGRSLFKFVNVNQIDLTGNGFLQEFLNAKRNLEICRNTAGCTLRFSNQGLPGQVNVPILSALFSTTGSQTAAGFSNTTNISHLDLNQLALMADRMDKALQGSRGPLAAFANDRFFRPNPQFDVAGLGTSDGISDYHSLQVQVRGRYRDGLQFAANYTFSKSIDNQSNETVGAGTGFDFPFDSNNIGLSRARSDFDVNHVVRAFVIYDLPLGRGKRWGSGWNSLTNHFLGGWQVNTIADISSGLPDSILAGTAGTNGTGQTFNYFIANVADCAPGARKAYGSANKNDPRGGVWTIAAADTGLFTMPAPGRIGTCGRNTFNGPGFMQFDLGIFKSFDVSETWKLDFRTEMFNVFNRAHFSLPTTNIQSGNFGRITSTRAPGRIIQFALKLNF
jgi:hypothetical protein